MPSHDTLGSAPARRRLCGDGGVGGYGAVARRDVRRPAVPRPPTPGTQRDRSPPRAEAAVDLGERLSSAVRACATNAGPHVGVFVQRSPAGADPRRGAAAATEPTSILAERVSIAAEGSTVVASWVTQRRLRPIPPGWPRVLWVRAAATRGRRGRLAHACPRRTAAWTVRCRGRRRPRALDLGGQRRDPHRRSDTDGRPGPRPRSRRRRRNRRSAEGYAGLPSAPAARRGDRVDRDRQRHPAALTSAVGERSRRRDTDPAVGPQPERPAALPRRGRRRRTGRSAAAIAYSTATSLELRTFDGVTLGAPSTVFTWQTTIAGTRFDDGYGPRCCPRGPARFAVAVAGCRRDALAKRPLRSLRRRRPDGASCTSRPPTAAQRRTRRRG